MRFLLKGDEQNVKEIAANAFRDLSAADLAKATTALLKVNPELKNVANLPPGTLIRVPPDIAKPAEDPNAYVDPIEGMVNNVIKELKALEAEINTSHTDHQEALGKYPENLKEAREIFAGRADAEAVASNLVDHLKKSKVSNEKNRERGLDAVRKMRETVAGLDR